MHILDLFEDVSNDVGMATLASDVTYAIVKAIYAGYKCDSFIELNERGEFFVYDLDKMGISQDFPFTEKMCLMVGAPDPKAVGKSGAVWKFENALLLGKFTSSVAVQGLRTMKNTDAKNFINSTEVITILKHEFMHVLDSVRTDGRIMLRKSNASDRAVYYNDPAEFNAYYHDACQVLTNIIKEYLDGKDGPYKDTLIDDLTDLYDITGDFKTDLARMVGKDHFTRLFIKWLTNDRRKAFLRRIYKLHHEVVLIMKSNAVSN